MAMRKIIHIDMDAFFASVEQRDFPEYRGKPVVVGGAPDARGVVSTCSYEARKYGIRSAMPTRTAYQLCPHGIFVAPRFDAYRQASEQIRAVFQTYTDIIEPLSLDEAYLDVSDCAQHNGSATWIARAICRDIYARVQLTASAGVSYNKFLAKVASGYKKPRGLTVIPPAKGEAFVRKLAIRQFYGVGSVTEKKMHALGIRTGADLKQQPFATLQEHFGKMARYLYDAARGVDHRPVQVVRTVKSIGNETTFAQDRLEAESIVPVINTLLQKAWQRCARKNKTPRTLTLKIKYHDFVLITRSQTCEDSYTDLSAATDAVQALLAKTAVGTKSVRLVGIAFSNFVNEDGEASEEDNDDE